MLGDYDGHAFVERVIAKYGSREAAKAELNRRDAEMDSRWNLDHERIGRILRAHLFVEHYLAAFVEARNPKLGSIDDARLSFAQLVELAAIDREPGLAELLPGVRRLNAVRNRLAHKIRADVTAEDAAVFLSARAFAALRSALMMPDAVRNEPLEVLEAFAHHTGVVLNATVDSPFEGCF